jgi:NADPH-dependent ferric siderophore reductase
VTDPAALPALARAIATRTISTKACSCGSSRAMRSRWASTAATGEIVRVAMARARFCPTPILVRRPDPDQRPVKRSERHPVTDPAALPALVRVAMARARAGSAAGSVTGCLSERFTGR